MKSVISVRDIEELVRSGQSLGMLPADAIYTPSARDYLRELEGNSIPKQAVTPTPTPAPTVSASSSGPVNSKSPRAEIDAYFASAGIEKLKEEICDVGRRLWQRAYVDGNGGNDVAASNAVVGNG